MLNLELCQRLILDEQEKMFCLDTLKLILYLSEKAHESGLISLEPEIEKSQSFLLSKALQFVIDGIEPEFIRSTLYNYIYIGNYSGKDLLERILIVEGTLSIQAGEKTSLILERLSSYFGEEFAKKIENFYLTTSANENDTLYSYIETIKDVHPFSQSTSLLEAPIQKMDNRSLQRLIREIDIQDLFTALKGASGKTQKKILNNTSKKIAKVLVEELSSDKHPTPHQIIECQNKILEIIVNLRASNDIL